MAVEEQEKEYDIIKEYDVQVANRQRERAIHKDSVVANLNPFKNKMIKQLPEMV